MIDRRSIALALTTLAVVSSCRERDRDEQGSSAEAGAAHESAGMTAPRQPRWVIGPGWGSAGRARS
jgi:hypothetical protein